MPLQTFRKANSEVLKTSTLMNFFLSIKKYFQICFDVFLKLGFVLCKAAKQPLKDVQEAQKEAQKE